MNKKIIIGIIVLLVILTSFITIKMFRTPSMDKKLGCDIYIYGDPALHFYPMNESSPDYTEYKSACESRTSCEWKLQDNNKYLCVDKK